MARLLVNGAEFRDSAGMCGSGGTLDFADARGAQGRFSYAAREQNSSWQLTPQPFTDVGTTWVTSYTRFYLRLMRGATNGNETKIWGWRGSLELANDAVELHLTTGNQLILYSKGNSATYNQIGSGTSSPLVIGEWYRIEVQLTFNTGVGGGPPYMDNSSGSLYMDGATVTSGQMSKATQELTGLSARQAMRFMIADHSSTTITGDAWYDLDDVAVDDSGLPGIGEVAMLPITGIGTFNSNWLSNGVSPKWQVISTEVLDSVHCLDANFHAITSTTAGAKISFTIGKFTSLGASAVRAIGISYCGVTGPGQLKPFLYINGAEINAPNFLSVPAGSSNGYVWDVSATGLSAAALAAANIEIGVIHDGTSSTTTICSLTCHAEVDQTTSPAAADSSLNVKIGTYTGNGIFVDVTDPGFVPDFLFVSGPSNAPVCRQSSPPGAFQPGTINVRSFAGWLPTTLSNGFRVAGNESNGLNANGTVYTYLALKDPASTIMNRGGFNKESSSGSIDNINQALTSVTFAPEWLWVFGLGNSIGGYVRGLLNVGDSSYPTHTAGAALADAIQSMAIGTFQTGTLLHGVTPALQWLSFLTAANAAKRLVQVIPYTGDGTTNRAIPVSLATDLGLVLVVPANTEGRTYKHLFNIAGTCQDFDSGAVSSGSSAAISNLQPSSFTVRGTGSLNTSGINYLAIAFAKTIPVTCVSGSDDIVQPIVGGGFGCANVSL